MNGRKTRYVRTVRKGIASYRKKAKLVPHYGIVLLYTDYRTHCTETVFFVNTSSKKHSAEL